VGGGDDVVGHVFDEDAFVWVLEFWRGEVVSGWFLLADEVGGFRVP